MFINISSYRSVCSEPINIAKSLYGGPRRVIKTDEAKIG